MMTRKHKPSTASKKHPPATAQASKPVKIAAAEKTVAVVAAVRENATRLNRFPARRASIPTAARRVR